MALIWGFVTNRAFLSEVREAEGKWWFRSEKPRGGLRLHAGVKVASRVEPSPVPPFVWPALTLFLLARMVFAPGFFQLVGAAIPLFVFSPALASLFGPLPLVFVSVRQAAPLLILSASFLPALQ